MESILSMSPDSLIVGMSPIMHHVRDALSLMAQSHAPVLITGPSGSGKEVAARELHRMSARAQAPFVAVNCGAIPRDLLESELFGHQKGAFTGAITARAGKFEQAGQGTIFLDEIGDMPMDMQVKILRVLEEKMVEPIGGHQRVPMQARIITATHCNLEEAICRQKFREDLYYRINVLPLHLPALSAHKEDLPHLVQYFLEKSHHPPARLTAEALDVLYRYDWPGNVRELRNFVERASLFAMDGVIHGHLARRLLQRGQSLPVSRRDETAALRDMFDLFDAGEEDMIPATPLPRQAAASLAADLRDLLNAGGCDLKAMVAAYERSFIVEALTASRGVVADAARLLKTSRTTLIEKIRRHGISAEDNMAY